MAVISSPIRDSSSSDSALYDYKWKYLHPHNYLYIFQLRCTTAVAMYTLLSALLNPPKIHPSNARLSSTSLSAESLPINIIVSFYTEYSKSKDKTTSQITWYNFFITTMKSYIPTCKFKNIGTPFSQPDLLRRKTATVLQRNISLPLSGQNTTALEIL